MLGNDDGDRTCHRQVDRQLCVPGSRQDFKQTLVAASSDHQWIRAVCIKDFLHAVTNAPIRAVHVTCDDEHHGQCQVMMRRIGQPQTTRERIEATLEGEEV